MADDDTQPPERVFVEKIGNREWTLTEKLLHIHDDVMLWQGNPRLRKASLLAGGAASEPELEAELEKTNGFAGLKKSIDDLGQMTPIYAWKPTPTAEKHLTLEGSTRLTIMRQLDRKYVSGTKKEGAFRYVRAKILPPEFGERERAILLARIHVRGADIRAWGRFIEAEFVHETVMGKDGQPPLMNVASLAEQLERSTSWVQRYRDAAEFAHRFVQHVGDDGVRLAAENFSVLEEVMKARIVGPMLRDYDNPKHDDLRAEVFDMVRNEVFKEYRDARFLHDFYEDADKWEQLKSGEKHVASTLVNDVKNNLSSPKAKIAAVPLMVKRTIERGAAEFDEEDVEALQKAIDHISDRVHEGVRPFRIALKKFTRAMTEASMADAKDLSAQELTDFREAREYFDGLVEKHWKASS